MLKLINGMEAIRPLMQGIGSLCSLVVAGYLIYVLTQRFSWAFALALIGSIISGVITAVWMLFSIQSHWKVQLLPLEIRRFLYLVIQCVYPFEIFVWTIALLLLARNHLRSTDPQP